MQISIIIPTFKNWDGLRACLDGLENQTLSNMSFEVIAINNDATVSIPSDIRERQNLTIETEPTLGSYAARNRGIALAKGSVFAFTDDDCIPQPGWLEHAMQCFGETGADIVAGNIALFRPENGGQLASIVDGFLAFRAKEQAQKGLAVTANLLVKRPLMERLGPFDTTTFSGGDYKWTGSATQSGGKLAYCQDAVVNHPTRQSIKDLGRKVRRIAGANVATARARNRVGPFLLRQISPPLRILLLPARKGQKPYSRPVSFAVMWFLKLQSVFAALHVLRGNDGERR